MDAPRVIPRPLTEDAARHNPSRWVCARRPERCDGVFWVYSQPMICPIREKCRAGSRNAYEWSLGEKINGRYNALDTDADWRRRHGTEGMVYRRLWGDYERKPPTREQKDRYNTTEREKRARLRPPPPPPKPRQVLPCGEDCDNCPYDGPCPYSDVDEDAVEEAERREKSRRQDKAKHQRERERRKTDPDYDAHMRELDKARCGRYYEKHGDEIRARARERYRQKRA